MAKCLGYIFSLVVLICSYNNVFASKINKKIFVQSKVLASNSCVINSNREIAIFIPKDNKKVKVGSFTITNCSFVLQNISADYLQMNVVGKGNQAGSNVGLVLAVKKGETLNIKNIFYQNTCYVISGVLEINGKRSATKLNIPCKLLKK